MPLLVVAYCVIPFITGDGMNIQVATALFYSSRAFPWKWPWKPFPSRPIQMNLVSMQKKYFSNIYIEKADLLMGFHGIHIWPFDGSFPQSFQFCRQDAPGCSTPRTPSISLRRWTARSKWPLWCRDGVDIGGAAMGIVPVNIGGFIVDFYDGVGSIAQITGKHGRYLCSWMSWFSPTYNWRGPLFLWV